MKKKLNIWKKTDSKFVQNFFLLKYVASNRFIKTKWMQFKMEVDVIQLTNFGLIWTIQGQGPSEPNSIWDFVIKFYKIWPPFQWATSLLTLVILYWVSGYYYNKFLSHKGGWMDTKTRIFMIVFDLILNFSIGIYYMSYRETFMGALMLKCPVFLSPVFWVIELFCFFIYFRYGSFFKAKK